MGTPSFVSSPFGGEALAVSAGNYGRIPAASAFVPGLRSFSIALDFKAISFLAPSQHISVFTMQGGDFTEGIFLEIGNGVSDPRTMETVVRDGPNFQIMTSTQTTSLLGEWHHAAITVDHGHSLFSMYLDGNLISQTPLTVGSLDPKASAHK